MSNIRDNRRHVVEANSLIIINNNSGKCTFDDLALIEKVNLKTGTYVGCLLAKKTKFYLKSNKNNFSIILNCLATNRSL